MAGNRKKVPQGRIFRPGYEIKPTDIRAGDLIRAEWFTEYKQQFGAVEYRANHNQDMNGVSDFLYLRKFYLVKEARS